MNANRAPEDRDLTDALARLDNPKAITLNAIAQVAEPDFAQWLRDRRNSRTVGHRLDAVGYVACRNDTTKDGRWKVGGKNQAIYVRADLTLRDRIAASAQLARGGR